MSFFDDADEPLTEQRTEPRRRRVSGGGGRSSGGSRRPPSSPRRPSGDQQALAIRRGVAIVILLIVVILVVVGVHSCEVSARNSSLKSYTNSVASVIERSDQTGKTFFTELASASGSTSGPSLQNEVNQTRNDAQGELTSAKRLSVPNQMAVAQQDLLLALTMRVDGLTNIANDIQGALSKATSATAVQSIAAEMARLYASDVVYTDYAAPAIAGALHGAGIAVETPTNSGEPIAAGQFVTNVQWVTPTYIAQQFNASLPSTASNHAPCACGDALQSVSVGGTQLAQGATNTVTASPPPTFSVTFSNDGSQPETNTNVEVKVKGTSVSGQAIQAQTTPGGSYTVQVPLSSSPPKGTYTVSATVEAVPGETVLTHNTQTFSVTFQ